MKRILLLLFALCACNALLLSAQNRLPDGKPPQTTVPAADDAVHFIRYFYTNCIFGSAECGPMLKKHCTARLLKKLRAGYGYDGDGYAVWLFRTGAQDGPSDVSEVTSVTASGDGFYRVDFIDRGIAGSRTLKIVAAEGTLKFDAIN